MSATTVAGARVATGARSGADYDRALVTAQVLAV